MNPQKLQEAQVSWAKFCAENLSKRPDLIRILMVGDVVGKPGRRMLKVALNQMHATVYPDLVTVNVENAAGGFGITNKVHDELRELGVDVMTMGNHWKDKPDVHKLRRTSPCLILPQNLNLEGVGSFKEFAIRRTHRIARVLNLMGLFAMKEDYASPFAFLNEHVEMLKSERVSGRAIVLADVHAEASSEKQVMAWKMDGITAMQIGTHTHVQTSDERVTSRGTAFLTDVGMTGPYDSVIGMNRHRVHDRFFLDSEQKKAHEVAKADSWFCGFLGEIDPATGLSQWAHKLQLRADEGFWRISTVARCGSSFSL